MAYLDSDQDEADTKFLLHAVDAAASGATSIQIFSPDTDVFVSAFQAIPGAGARIRLTLQREDSVIVESS